MFDPQIRRVAGPCPEERLLLSRPKRHDGAFDVCGKVCGLVREGGSV